MPGDSAAPSSTDDAEAIALLEHLDRVDLERTVVAGEYVRFDETARNSLKDFRAKVAGALSGANRRPANFLIWGAPGSGKSFLVQEVARSLGGAAHLVDLNLAQLDPARFGAGLAEAGSGEADLVCLVDEVDAHAEAAWPLQLLLPALEPAVLPAHRTVFCLAGSGGADLEEFKSRMRARPKGPDLLNRIPRGNEFTVPSLGVGDKLCVATAQILAAAASEGRQIREIERFALYYIAIDRELRSARQLRALATEAARRIPPGEDRFRFDHLFAPGDPENKRFWHDHPAGQRRLSGVFAPIVGAPRMADTARPAGVPGATRAEPPEAPNPRTRIAVLPFRNISPDPSDSYFSDGLTEELIATVSRIGGLRVIARTSVLQYREGTKRAADTGRELRVGSLLEGSVRRAGNELRVTAQLIDAGTEEPMWSVTFDRHYENIFAIQEELARKIADSLHVQLVGGEPATLGRIPTRSLEAYDLYLQGRQRFFEVTAPGFTEAIGLFEKAIDLDPAFALAYCGLAEAQALQGNRGYVPLRPALERAEKSARVALRLDPELGEAHAALAPILYNRYDWEGALRELDRAIALEPNNVQAHFWRAVATSCVGRPADGLGNALRAVELDPMNPRRRIILSQQYYWLHRYDEAIAVLRSPILAQTTDAVPMLAYNLLMSGRPQEAVAALTALRPGDRDLPLQSRIDLAAISARAGRTEVARATIEELLNPPPGELVPAGALAWIYASLADFDSAADWYARAHTEGSMTGVPDLAGDPFLDPFRNSSRFPEILRLFGFHLPDQASGNGGRPASGEGKDSR